MYCDISLADDLVSKGGKSWKGVKPTKSSKSGESGLAPNHTAILPLDKNM